MEMTVNSRSGLSIRQMTITGLCTAVTCIIGPLSLPIPVSPVPISLTMFALYLAAYVLGTKLGTISCLLYLLLGAVGLPVFSGFSGGLGKLTGPTGGYLVGFIFLAFICGFFIDRFPGKLWLHAVGMVCGITVCYIFGTAWLALQMDMTFTGALAIGVIPYLPGDAVKIIIALIAGPILRRQTRRILLQS